MEMLQGVWKQHLRPCAVVGYGVEIFLLSPPNYVTRSPGEQAHVSFYFRLFSEDFIDEACKQRCLSGIQLTLSSEQRDSCEGPLSLTEPSNALKSLNLNRFQGLDGLTVEFYLHVWDVLAPLLLCVANETPSKYKSAITL